MEKGLIKHEIIQTDSDVQENLKTIDKMIERIKQFYAPAPHIDRLPDNMIEKTYK